MIRRPTTVLIVLIATLLILSGCTREEATASLRADVPPVTNSVAIRADDHLVHQPIGAGRQTISHARVHIDGQIKNQCCQRTLAARGITMRARAKSAR
jgi:hypothetical protein